MPGLELILDDRSLRAGLARTAAEVSAFAKRCKTEVIMPKFNVKRVAPVDAIRFDGTNHDEIYRFGGTKVTLYGRTRDLAVLVPGGLVTVKAGAWVVKNARGDLAVVDAEAFAATHEAVDA